MSFWSSPSVIGWSGRLRSWLTVVVKPLTSSPAMPMTTWLGGSRPSPRPPGARRRSCRRPRRCRRRSRTACAKGLTLAPDPAHGAVARLVDVEDQRLRELGPDVEGGAGGERLLPVALPDAAPEGHQAVVASADRIAASASGSASRRVPLPWAISGRPPPLPSRQRHRVPDEVTGGDPLRHEVVGDGHEQLWLVGVEAERDDAVAEHAPGVTGQPFSSSSEPPGSPR